MAKNTVLWAPIHREPNIHMQPPTKTQFQGYKSMTFSLWKDVIEIKHCTKMHFAW